MVRPCRLRCADAARICPGVAPGGGRLIGRLKQHEDEVSVSAKALKANISRLDGVMSGLSNAALERRGLEFQAQFSRAAPGVIQFSG